jgi:hypothetical protein
MGVGVAIGATLLGGYMQGRAQRQAYEAQARQADQQAQIAYNNAAVLQEQGEQQAQNNAVNEENKRRRILQQRGKNIANVGASGVAMSGSALDFMADSQYNSEMELAIDRWNGRQQVDQYFQNSTDNLNQGDVYKRNASQYRKAGKRAMINSMLQSGLSLAGNLYSPKSVGAQKEAASSGSSTWGSANYNYNGGNSSIRHFNSGTRGFEYAAAGTPIYQQRQLGKYKLSW